MNLIAELPGLPYALRVVIPEEYQEQAGDWLDAAEHYDLLSQKALMLGKSSNVDKEQLASMYAHNGVVRNAAFELSDQRVKVMEWLVPLLESHGFTIERDVEDEGPIIYFEHETIWLRRRPKGVVKDLATLHTELKNVKFDGTVAGLVEALQNFPGGWELPFDSVFCVNAGDVTLG